MRSETKKVIWPTPKQVVNNTGVALGMMIVSALVLWGFDTLAKLGVQTLIGPSVRQNGGRSEVVCSPHLLRL